MPLLIANASVLSREVVGGGASGAAAPPIFLDLFYKVPSGGQSLCSAGPTNNFQPATSLVLSDSYDLDLSSITFENLEMQHFLSNDNYCIVFFCSVQLFPQLQLMELKLPAKLMMGQKCPTRAVLSTRIFNWKERSISDSKWKTKAKALTNQCLLLT